MSPSMIALVVLAAVFVLWVLLHLKTSRPDGTLVESLHPYRRLMSYIMVTRNESIVYFDAFAEVDSLLRYLKEFRSKSDVEIDITHCLIGAGFIGLSENPRMNRFSVGRRLYQRNGTFITFSMKRKQLDKQAKLATVKLKLEPGETFAGLASRINAQIAVERSGEKTYADKEFSFFDAVPRPVLRFGVWLLKTLDYYGILPASFIENDGLYTSMFSANLGSLGMGAAYHHLYEWGNCPLFLMVGRIEDRPVVVDGRVEAKKMIHLRFSYDERIDDGLNARFGIESLVRVVENPYEYLGCLKDDGSDARPLDKAAPIAQ